MWPHSDQDFVTPTAQPEVVIRAIDRGFGLSIAFHSATLIFYRQDGNRSTATGSVQVVSRGEDLLATAWVEHGQYPSGEFSLIVVTGKDTAGDQYQFQFRTSTISAGAATTVLSGTVMGLSAKKLERAPPRSTVVLRLPSGLAYPFSSVTQTIRTWGDELVHSTGVADGYFGRSKGVDIDIANNRTSNTLTVRSDEKAAPERLMESVDGAASYVLGLSIDPIYASAQHSEARLVVMLERNERRAVNQIPAPLDLRMAAEDFSHYFATFFHHSMRASGEERTRAHALVHDVYQTFKSTYVPHQVLLLCIAIEKLLRESVTPRPEDQFLAAEIEAVKDAVRTANIEQRRIDRAVALLGMLNSPSISYLFDRAIGAGVLNLEHKKTWNDNRSVFAHGGSTDDGQKLLRDRSFLLNAFHRLICHEIGLPIGGTRV
jgi:hypothetical protein